MSSRHAFAYVLATVVFAIVAALLHPGLVLSPLSGVEPQAAQRTGASGQTR